MRSFLGIVGILGFCYFVIFPSCLNTFILPILYFGFQNRERFFLIRGCRHDWPNYVKTLVHLYVDFLIFVFFN